MTDPTHQEDSQIDKALGEDWPVKLRIEIKPIGLDRSDPTTELRRAYIDVVDGLSATLLGSHFGEGKVSATHLRWMCVDILQNIRTMPVDKMGRWVGFIQGVMAANGVLDVDAERDRTRPIFGRVTDMFPA